MATPAESTTSATGVADGRSSPHATNTNAASPCAIRLMIPAFPILSSALPYRPNLT